MSGALPLPPPTVLVVEDVLADRVIAGRVLARAWPRTHVVHAHHGGEAIELLEACTPATLPGLILLDINMPIVDGHEFLQAWFVERGREGPSIAVLSSSDLSEDRSRARAFPEVVDYLVKPLRTTQLERLAEMLCGGGVDPAARGRASG